MKIRRAVVIEDLFLIFFKKIACHHDPDTSVINDIDIILLIRVIDIIVCRMSFQRPDDIDENIFSDPDPGSRRDVAEIAALQKQVIDGLN